MVFFIWLFPWKRMKQSSSCCTLPRYVQNLLPHLSSIIKMDLFCYDVKFEIALFIRWNTIISLLIFTRQSFCFIFISWNQLMCPVISICVQKLKLLTIITMVFVLSMKYFLCIVSPKLMIVILSKPQLWYLQRCLVKYECTPLRV